MRRFLRLVLALASLAPLSAQAQQSYTITFPAAHSSTPLDGRLLLLFSKNSEVEPRFEINDTPKTQIVFGTTVDGWKPGAPILFPNAATGYPVDRISDIPPGDYTVQAVLNRYQTYHRADGKTVKLPPDMGEGQHWAEKPGNFYSKPILVHVGTGGPVALSMTETIPPITPTPDSKYIRRIRIQSALLSKFWGTPIYLSAMVLVPDGFDSHPNAHYPLVIFHDHYTNEFNDFRETPPDATLKPDFSERFHLAGYNRIQQEEAYKNFQDWTAPNKPRFLIVKLQHANPFYDDSYAVNSANLGPYGDAIETELVPAIEKQFRGLGAGWARFMYGGSTGGWESLAVQILYPTHYNGAFAACPDPVDFHAYMTTDLYARENMFWIPGANKKVEQPAMRNYLGQTLISMRDNVQFEAALGDHGRSGDQFDIWQAVYSPVGPDGYPASIFDKTTGIIDHTVLEYWQKNYDLDAILQRDWNSVGPDIAGKIHLYVGYDDTYMLNNAVYLMEDFLKTTGTPGHGVPYGGEVTYGPKAEHCWNGDPTQPNWYTRLHYNQMYVTKILDRIANTAPAGADLTSWKY